MFGFSGNLLAGQYDTQRERSPPGQPTPIVFPAFQSSTTSTLTIPKSWIEQPSAVQTQFLRLRKAADVNEETLSLLNITFQSPCDFETMFVDLPDNARSYLPPKSWLDAANYESIQSAQLGGTLLSNGRSVPGWREFCTRAKELSFKNGDAYCMLSRKNIGPNRHLRLVHFRKFWEGLDNMAYYWDTSLDDYIKIIPNPIADNHKSASCSKASIDALDPEHGDRSDSTGCNNIVPGEQEPRKKARTMTTQGENIDNISTQQHGSRISIKHVTPSEEATHVAPAMATPRSALIREGGAPADACSNVPSYRYRGYRIGNGADMPDQYRIDCVRGFLEPIAWAFDTTLTQHRRPPVLTMDHLRFPVRMSSVAWRGSQDRARARQGWIEGPVLGMQCRPDVKFGASRSLALDSALDVTREIGGLLLLAQERAREGLQERRSGEGKWWATKQRWGGSSENSSTEISRRAPRDLIDMLEVSPVKRNQDGSKVRRKLTPIETWKVLRPSNPLWDPKTVYKAIGKGNTAEWDEIFMVSSLYHHICLLKLRVHPLYVQYLTDGCLSDASLTQTDWCSPVLQRTRWFDLFNIGDRLEAMRGLWGVMSYLMRSTDDSNDRIGSTGNTTS